MSQRVASRRFVAAGLSVLLVTDLAFAAGAVSGHPAESTMRRHCDLCSSPSISESPPSSSIQPYRPQHPKGSRPHRLPKGRYKLTPYKGHIRPSTFRGVGTRRLRAGQAVYVIDGDTLSYGRDRIRLRGIDAPELHEAGGDAARQRLEQVLHLGSIRIVPYGQDLYGRTVADVFVDGRNVADLLKQEGYAKGGD